MKSIATRRVWQLFRGLPVDVQHLTAKNCVYGARIGAIRLSTSASSKAVKNRFAVRIGGHYRALGRLRLDHDNVGLDW